MAQPNCLVDDQLLFFEVLGGDFQPPNDPNSFPRNLGSLALATINCGEIIRDVKQPDLCGWAYRPTWAPSVVVEAWCSDENKAARLYGLDLTATEADARLQIWDSPIRNIDRRQVEITYNDEETVLPMGPDLDQLRIRRLIAFTANQFFITAEHSPRKRLT